MKYMRQNMRVGGRKLKNRLSLLEPMLYIANTIPVPEPSDCLWPIRKNSSGQWAVDSHVEEVEIGLHCIDATHQGSVEAIQTPTQIRNQKTAVQTEHAQSVRTVLNTRDIMSKLDGFVDSTQILCVVIRSRNSLMEADHCRLCFGVCHDRGIFSKN